MNIAKGLGLLQKANAIFEKMKQDGTMKEVEEALAALHKAYETYPELKELMQEMSSFKLEGNK